MELSFVQPHREWQLRRRPPRFGRWDQFLDDDPLAVGQIGRV